MVTHLRKKILAVLLVSLQLLSSTLPLYAGRALDEDFGIWSLYEIEAKRGKAKYKIAEELRFREAAGLHYFETRIGGSYDVLSYLNLGGEYLQTRQKQRLGTSDRFLWESRPRIFATLKEDISGFVLENRNMLEFRFREKNENSLRYRNGLTIIAPWKWTRFEFQPFISDEIFLESNRNGLVENRLSSGLRMHLWQNLYGSLYYLRQSQKNNAASWKDFNIAGFSLKWVL